MHKRPADVQDRLARLRQEGERGGNIGCLAGEAAEIAVVRADPHGQHAEGHNPVGRIDPEHALGEEVPGADRARHCPAGDAHHDEAGNDEEEVYSRAAIFCELRQERVGAVEPLDSMKMEQCHGQRGKATQDLDAIKALH